MDTFDWFDSDALLAELFSRLNGQAREAAVAAVNGAADAARAQLPSLGAAARVELGAALDLIRAQLDRAVTEQTAHAIRILADAQPQLRTQVNELAREAGVGASQGAIDNARRESASLRRWVIAGGVVFATLAAGVALVLAQQSVERERDREVARRNFNASRRSRYSP